MPVRLLAVGDIHLGRRPSRLPDQVLERFDERALTPAAAWHGAVEEAIGLGVDAVLLAGDVVEQNDDFYEAYPALRAGVERLAASGIAVVGVAGNHDDQVLPRLADTIDGFHLLGRGGRWETVTVAGASGGAADVLGWSFPRPHVHADPLASLPAPAGERPVVGLLHCDRNQPGSPYAPVRSADLDAAPVDAWLLGHIHAPDALAAPRPIGYLGSLSALDPGEAGARGPWLLEVEHRGAVQIAQIASAPLRFERIEIALDGLGRPDELREHVVAAIADLDDRLSAAGARARAVGCRLVLTGRTRWRGALARELAAADPRAIVDVRGDVTYFVEGWRNALSPAVALEELASDADPVGLLARRILVLRAGPGGPGWRDLVEPVRRRLAAVAEAPAYARLEAPPPDEERAAALLEESALRALDALLAQREGTA